MGVHRDWNGKPGIGFCIFCESREGPHLTEESTPWTPGAIGRYEGRETHFHVSCAECGAKGPGHWDAETAIVLWNEPEVV